MKNLRRSYSEIYEILNLIEEPYRNRIPKKFYDFINLRRDRDYHPEIRTDIPLEDQGLMEDTIAILAMIKLEYLSNSDEKDELLEILRDNEEQFEKYKKEFTPREVHKEDNYSDKVIENYLRTAEIHVKNRDKEADEDAKRFERRVKENKELTLYNKPNIFKRIFKKIIDWFRK